MDKRVAAAFWSLLGILLLEFIIADIRAFY